MENATKKTEPILAKQKQKIISLIRGLIDEEQKAPSVDRRHKRRHTLSVPVIVRPVGDCPMAEEFVGVTRDISTIGISFFHTAPVNEHYLRLHFPESPYSAEGVTIEVARCRKIGPLYEIAGKILLR
jgi:hypothetical protein